MPIKSIFSSALIGLLASASFASAHTWVEQLMVIASNGTMVGEAGYPRGNVLRGTPGFGDPSMVNLIPPDGRTINQIQPSDLMCKSSQTSQTQTGGSPRLQAAAGDAVALRFQENGHVTLPDNQPGKPQNRGTIYVYGTNKPSADDSFLAIHRVWTPDGKGGDGRGRLLSTRNFDDGQCFQTNGGQISQQRQQQFKHPFDMLMGNDLWCQQDIQIPANIPSDQPYTLYWVWDWPTMPGTAGFPNGKQEIYTTCMDIDIVGDTGIVPVSKAQVNFAQGQPYDIAAVADQMSDLANPTAVKGQTIPFMNVPTTFLTQPASSSTSTSPLLTASLPTGSTIAFSASATGPVAGGASEASVSAATASDTGVPEFLSIHTGSTAGPGLETQTFTVLPVSVTANGNGRGGNNGPQITGAPNLVGNNQIATLTEYESITQTLLQTVYVTKYTKRDAGESGFATSATAPSPAFSHFSHTPSGSLSFTRSVGPPPWFNASRASGTGWPRGRPTGWASHNRSRTGDSDTHYGSGNCSATTTAQTTIMVQSIVSLTKFMQSSSMSQLPTLADTAVQSATTIGVDTITLMTYLPSPPSGAAADASASTTSTFTSTVTIYPSVPVTAPSTLSSPSPSSFPTQSLTIMPIPVPVETPSPSPTISTDHAAFRLRARNPFVMLGWISGSTDPQPTES